MWSGTNTGRSAVEGAHDALRVAVDGVRVGRGRVRGFDPYRGGAPRAAEVGTAREVADAAREVSRGGCVEGKATGGRGGWTVQTGKCGSDGEAV